MDWELARCAQYPAVFYNSAMSRQAWVMARVVAVQGSARVISCLQRQREKLEFTCRATLFDQEQQMAEDIDFQFPLKVRLMCILPCVPHVCTL